VATSGLANAADVVADAEPVPVVAFYYQDIAKEIHLDAIDKWRPKSGERIRATPVGPERRDRG
jgi:hypothetical protein